MHEAHTSLTLSCQKANARNALPAQQSSLAVQSRSVNPCFGPLPWGFFGSHQGAGQQIYLDNRGAQEVRQVPHDPENWQREFSGVLSIWLTVPRSKEIVMTRRSVSYLLFLLLAVLPASASAQDNEAGLPSEGADLVHISSWQCDANATGKLMDETREKLVPLAQVAIDSGNGVGTGDVRNP